MLLIPGSRAIRRVRRCSPPSHALTGTVSSCTCPSLRVTERCTGIGAFPRFSITLVIVHPDEVTCLVLLRDDIREALVDLDVRIPVAHVKRHLIE